jgi:hypothetical protein
LEDHFRDKELIVHALYDLLLETLQQFGSVQAEVQFAAAVPRKRWLDGYLWLRRQATHPRIYKIEMGIFRDYGHVFRLRSTEELDEELVDLLQEAYIVGCEV